MINDSKKSRLSSSKALSEERVKGKIDPEPSETEEIIEENSPDVDDTIVPELKDEIAPEEVDDGLSSDEEEIVEGATTEEIAPEPVVVDMDDDDDDDDDQTITPEMFMSQMTNSKHIMDLASTFMSEGNERSAYQLAEVIMNDLKELTKSKKKKKSNEASVEVEHNPSQEPTPEEEELIESIGKSFKKNFPNGWMAIGKTKSIGTPYIYVDFGLIGSLDDTAFRIRRNDPMFHKLMIDIKEPSVYGVDKLDGVLRLQPDPENPHKGRYAKVPFRASKKTDAKGVIKLLDSYISRLSKATDKYEGEIIYRSEIPDKYLK